MQHQVLREVPAQLQSGRLLLRPPRPGDGAVLYEAVSESLPELRRFIASVPWVAAEQSVDASEIYCRTASANFLLRQDMPYLIFAKRSGQLIGSTGLHRPDWSVPKFEVGYWCRTSCTGQGYITEAVKILVAMAEGTLGAARLELITDEGNSRSRAVAQRADFQLEGILRGERRSADGSLANTCVYARIAQPA